MIEIELEKNMMMLSIVFLSTDEGDDTTVIYIICNLKFIYYIRNIKYIFNKRNFGVFVFY